MTGERTPASPSEWQALLVSDAGDGGPLGFRLVRFLRDRAIVEVEHLEVARARERWNGRRSPSSTLRTVRSWGTLWGAKAWLRGPP